MLPTEMQYPPVPLSWQVFSTDGMLSLLPFHMCASQCAVCLQQVQEVCQLVAVRGARLTAAAIAGMLRHLGRDDRSGPDAPRNVVAVEGAVLRK